MGLVDKDGDTVKAWDGKGKPPADSTALDANDNDPTVGATGSGGGANDPAYQQWLKENALLSKPSISVSTEAETTADINAAFKEAFAEDAPKELAAAYYKELRALQSKRVTGGTSPTSKVNVNVQGVSQQEIKTILKKYVAAAANDKVRAAESGDPVAKAALMKGNFGVTYTTLKNAYAENGLPLNFQSLGKLAIESIANPETLKGNLNLINMQAKTYFPALADKIDKGYTVKQLLTPYINTRANILEEDPETIDIAGLKDVAKDPKALMNLYDYEISLRKDPKWRFTKNANDSIGNVARTIATTFGLMG